MDEVVLGAGPAGMTSAAEGDATVLVIEGAPRTGGSALTSGAAAPFATADPARA